MPVEISVKTDKDGRQRVVGRVFPGHYAFVNNFGPRGRKSFAVHVAPNNSSAAVYEFGNGSYTSISHPGYRFVPLGLYSPHNLDKVLHSGQKFEAPFTTKSQRKGRLALSFLDSHRGARTTLSAGRHK